MNMKIGTEAAEFPEKEYILVNGIFVAVYFCKVAKQGFIIQRVQIFHVVEKEYYR